MHHHAQFVADVVGEVDVEARFGVMLQCHQATREVAAVGLVAREAAEQHRRMLVREPEQRMLPRVAPRPFRRQLAVHGARDLAQIGMAVVVRHRPGADVLLDQAIEREHPYRDARVRLEPLQLGRLDGAVVVLVQPQLVARVGVVAQEAAEMQVGDGRQLARPVPEERDGNGLGRHQRTKSKVFIRMVLVHGCRGGSLSVGSVALGMSSQANRAAHLKIRWRYQHDTSLLDLANDSPHLASCARNGRTQYMGGAGLRRG